MIRKAVITRSGDCFVADIHELITPSRALDFALDGLQEGFYSDYAVYSRIAATNAPTWDLVSSERSYYPDLSKQARRALERSGRSVYDLRGHEKIVLYFCEY